MIIGSGYKLGSASARELSHGWAQYCTYQLPPICSWWTSRVSPSCMSSYKLSAVLSSAGIRLCAHATKLHFSTYRVWVVLWCDALSVEEESHATDVLSLAITECVHQLAEGGCALDLEEDLIVVVGNLDVQMFAGASILRLGLDVVGRAVVRHYVVRGCVGSGLVEWCRARLKKDCERV